MKIDYSGQTDLFNPREFGWPVHMIGAGGIGSSAIQALAKLGIRILHMWDDDRVEPHNLPNQVIYRASDLGLSKVDAAAAYLERQESETQVFAHPERANGTTPFEGVVISGVDSMKSRAHIWEAVAFNSEVPLYIDARIGGVNLEVLAFDPSDPDAAESYASLYLTTDDKVAPLPCAERTVIDPAGIVGNLIVTQLRLWARRQYSGEGVTHKAVVTMNLNTMDTTSSEVL